MAAKSELPLDHQQLLIDVFPRVSSPGYGSCLRFLGKLSLSDDRTFPIADVTGCIYMGDTRSQVSALAQRLALDLLHSVNLQLDICDLRFLSGCLLLYAGSSLVLLPSSGPSGLLASRDWSPPRLNSDLFHTHTGHVL